MIRPVFWLLCLIHVASCGGSQAAVADPIFTPAEALNPLTGDEPRYLAFQVFQGGRDPSIPFDRVMVYTPKEKIAAVVDDIVTTIGVTGGARARLAVMIGPISFDHTDEEVRQIIDDGFAIAREKNIAVGFHIDDSMFWSRRTDLISDPDNIEWTDFARTRSTGLLLTWAEPPAKMCFNAPKIRAEVTRRARDVIGAAIAAHVATLRAEGKEALFAGVIAGWETHMGQDVVTKDRVGFHALTNRGFGPNRPPADISAEIASIVQEFVGLWTSGLAQAGIDRTRIYTHVAFVSRRQFATLPTPAGVTYEMVLDHAPSSQRPSVAFDVSSRPGFTTYPTLGLFDQIAEERAGRGSPAWASSEGTNVIPGEAVGSSQMSMEAYLAKSFNHGATLVTLFSWGIGGPSVKTTNPFRVVTEGPDALAAYVKFLRQ